MFLTFRDRSAGYTIKYPEGWARRGSGTVVTFADKDKSIKIAVPHGRLPTGVTRQAPADAPGRFDERFDGT